MHTAMFRAGAAFALALSIYSSASRAGPADYVFTPIVEAGEREVELKFGSAQARDGSRVSAQALSLAYGVNQYWFTEVNAKWHKPAGETHSFDAWEWENRFQLTEQGKYPVDLGFVLEIERPQDRSEGYEIKWGPLLQTEFGLWQLNTNLLIQKNIRNAEPAPAEMSYQAQLKYRYSSTLEFGAQALGNMGPWNKWAAGSEQTHSIGPALFGQIKLEGRQRIKYNIAVLLGTNNAAPRNTVRGQIEYEF